MGELIETALSLDWGLIMGTLMIRFVGVFIVLAVLMIGMIILGKVVSSLVEMQETKKAENSAIDAPAAALVEEPEREGGEEEVVAVIGAAIAMAMDLEHKTITLPTPAGISAGSWAMAGRAAQINRRLQGGGQRRS